VTVGLLAMVALLALTGTSAFAATPLAVTETTDAPLESGASTCESTDVAKGCTLRAAVELADSEGIAVTIDVPEGTYEETHIEPALMVETGTDITISGAGAGKTIIEGDAKDRVFEVRELSSLTLAGVTVKNGLAGNGGGVFVSSLADLTVEDSAITENTADNNGGGIFGETPSDIYVRASTIEGNSAREDGGGIYGEEDDAIVEDDSTIAHNNAQYHGGGIYVEGAELAIKGSTIAANDAEYDGGGIYGSKAYITIEQGSTITENETTSSSGGGIATFTESGQNGEDCEELYGELIVVQSTISDNKAAVEDEGDGGGIFAETDEYGCEERVGDRASARHAAAPRRSPRAARRRARPAIGPEFLEGGALTVEESTIVGNEAGYYGGGIEERGGDDPIINSTITENEAGDEGGGIYVGDEEYATLISDTVAYNKTDSDHLGDNLSADDTSAIYLRNTIVAEEQGEHEDNCEGEVESLVPDAGYNLDYPSKAVVDSSSDSCGLSQADQDLVGEEPGFEGGLEDHGGPTETIALGASSPAIGVVPLAGDCEEEAPEGPGSVDQRREPRPGISGDGCDIGAYEYQGARAPSYSLSLEPPTGESKAGETETHSVTATVTEEGAPVVVTRAVSGAVTPVPDAEVTFTITGQNEGVTGTCATPEGTSDPDCETNSEGKVVFTYADKKGAGKDTIDASVGLGGKKLEKAASMTWTAIPVTPAPPAATPEAKKEVLSIKVVSPVQCASKRDITIHIQNVKQLGIVSAVVSIDGQHKRTLSGTHLSTGIDLVGLPPGTFTVEIVARTSSGHTLKGERVYHTCHTKLPGHSYLKL
jgi:predicted outer membrane repeat protein